MKTKKVGRPRLHNPDATTVDVPFPPEMIERVDAAIASRPHLSRRVVALALLGDSIRRGGLERIEELLTATDTGKRRRGKR
jgi:hypothetical protein